MCTYHNLSTSHNVLLKTCGPVLLEICHLLAWIENWKYVNSFLGKSQRFILINIMYAGHSVVFS